MMRMMVDAKNRHAGNLTATRGPVNVTARGMHDAGTLRQIDGERPNCAHQTL
jgi:hypothetical protein